MRMLRSNPARAFKFRWMCLGLAGVAAGGWMGRLNADLAAPQAPSMAVDFGEAPLAPEGQPVVPHADGIGPLSVTGGFAVDTSSREASRIFYNTIYASSEGFVQGWTGSMTTGDPGSNSPAFDEAVLRRINYYRAMAGIPADLTFDSVYAAKTQRAALMMSVNRTLSHTPPSTWTFYTAEGAEAAGKSNLALGVTGPAAIDGLIFDTGANNAAAGHRRWFLYPQTRKTGTGNTPSIDGFPAANVTWVVDSNYGSTRPATRDDFVAWPPAGFVPYNLVPARWSFSHPGGTFGSANVTVTRDGVSIPVRIESRQTGFGEAAIVWVTGDTDPNTGPATPFPRPLVDSTNIIEVSGVMFNGTPRTFTYQAVLFDPARPGVDYQPAVPTGPDSAPLGSGADYSFAPVANADSYRWRQATLAAYTKVEGAEDAVPAVDLATTAGYSAILSGTAASGQRSFHLAHPSPERQRVTLTANLLLGAAPELRFAAFLGLASPGQVAKAQISTDGGSNWQDVWTRTGTITGAAPIPKVVFEPITVSLAAFAGRIAQVRFVFDYLSGQSYFPQTASGFGFYLDDIAVTDSRQLTGVTTTSNPSPAFHFVPPNQGQFLLQVQARYYGEFYGEYGAPKVVNGVPAALVLTGLSAGANGLLTLDFTAPTGVTSGFILEKAGQPSGPWTSAGGSAVANGAGGYRFSGIGSPSDLGFFRVRTP